MTDSTYFVNKYSCTQILISLHMDRFALKFAYGANFAFVCKSVHVKAALELLLNLIFSTFCRNVRYIEDVHKEV